MAITLRKGITSVKPGLPIKSKPIKKVYTLPTSAVEPSSNLGDYSWLIYGQKKIGKTTLASLFPDAIFFMFEPGAKALRVYRVDCNEWEDAIGYIKLLEGLKEQGKLGFKTIVLDTGFEMHAKCATFTCKRLGIEYPREDNFGKDWAAIKTEFREFHARVFALGIGVVILCHETVKEQQTFTGNKYDQVIPLLAKAADDYYRAVIDNVVWYHYRGKDRFLQIRGTDHAMAGMALQADKFFQTPEGDQVYSIPIPSEPMIGMQAIVSAFKNEQTQTFKEETEKLSDQAVKSSVNTKLIKAQKQARKR